MQIRFLGAFATPADARRCLRRLRKPFGDLDVEVFRQIAETGVAHGDKRLIREAGRAWWQSAELRRTTGVQRRN